MAHHFVGGELGNGGQLGQPRFGGEQFANVAELLANRFGFVHVEQCASRLSIEANGYVAHCLNAASDDNLALAGQYLTDACRDRLVGRYARLCDRVSGYFVGEAGR